MATPVRSAKVRPTALSLDREARIILERCAGTSKSYGHFLSRLLYEFESRLQERAARDADYAELQRLYGLPVREEVGSEK